MSSLSTHISSALSHFLASHFLELNLIYKNASQKAKLKLHFCLLIFFLIVGHVAMIFGMVDPTITGYKAENGAMDMQMNMPMNMPARYADA